jgi:hypothetical protein
MFAKIEILRCALLLLSYVETRRATSLRPIGLNMNNRMQVQRSLRTKC